MSKKKKYYEKVDFYLYGGSVITSHNMKKKSIDELKYKMEVGATAGVFDLIADDDSDSYFFYIKDLMMISTSGTFSK